MIFTAKDGSQLEAGAGTEKADKIFSFQGKKQSLEFVSVFPASAARSGLQVFSIRLQEEDDEAGYQGDPNAIFSSVRGREWRQERGGLIKACK